MRKYLQRTSYQQLGQLLLPHWRLLLRLTGAAGLLILTEGLGLSIVLFVLGGLHLDRAAQQVPWIGAWLAQLVTAAPEQRIYSAAAALVVLMSLRGVAQYVQQTTETRLRITIESDLQYRLFALLHQVQLTFLQQQQTGALTTTLLQYTVQIGQLVSGCAKGIVAALTLVAYLMVALWVSWQLSLLALALMTLTGLCLRPFLLTRSQRIYTRARNALKEAGATAHESLSGMQDIHLFNGQRWSQARFAQPLGRYHRLAYQGAQVAGLVAPLFGLLNALLFAGIMIGMINFSLADPALLVLQITLFLVLAYRLNAPLHQLNQWQAQFVQAAPALEAVLASLQRDDKPWIQEGSLPFPGLKQAIHLAHVTFQYSPQDPPILADVTITIPKGQVTALVGASGSGKSTLLHLITRLYEPTSGQIEVDGVALPQFTLTSWRDALAVVGQEPFLFHDTIWANLQFAQADATATQMQQAITLAQADAFIQNLPHGFQTSLQERGVRLSGGQRQRIALARALLRRAELLILDEATNELDAQTELAFQNALAQGRGERTVLLIAHRLATVRHADQIIVLEKGQVVEQGTHNELLQRGGAYCRLVQAQMLL
ncbi:MAG: ABC transporter ATP-binding protein [Caldilineaceae bacterium]|nr:ABC transporter ATP-binding protein [Caldilineaceae bacterium]